MDNSKKDIGTSIGKGIFGWYPTERRSDRYGNFNLMDEGLADDARAAYTISMPKLLGFADKKVRITCVVLEDRDSTHIGDMFHNIGPTRPDKGEVVELGVGILRVGLNPSPAPSKESESIGLEPTDGRSTLWIDPRLFYRLHEQTVEVFIALVDNSHPCHPVPDLRTNVRGGLKATGDGSFQTKGEAVKEGDRVAPKITPLGDGLTAMSVDFARGEDVTVIHTAGALNASDSET